MSKRLVIILWSLVGLLAALTLIVNSSRNRAADSPTRLSPGATLLAELPIQKIASVKFEDAEHTATLTRGETQWEVAERADFKADFAKFSNLLRVLTEATVAQNLPAGPAFNARFGMDPDAESQENHGYKVTFLNAEGKELESLAIGKTTSADSLGQGPQSAASSGRYVRLGSEPESIYAINEPFFGLTGDPAAWVDQTFIQIEGIASVDLATPQEKEVQGWTISRPDAASDFTIENLTAGRELDPTKTNPIKNVLSNPTFNDVLSEEEAQSRRDNSQARQLVIKTFDTFRYTIDYAPETTEGEDAASSGQNFIAKVEVSAELPATDGESEGQADRKALQAKLAREQAFAGRYFLLPSYLFSPVNIGLTELTKELPKPEPAPAAAPQAVSPPMAMPPLQVPPASSNGSTPSSTMSNNSNLMESISEEDIRRMVEEAKKADEAE